jgi:hypothetical protein
MSAYDHTNFRHGAALSEDDLRRMAPSIFAVQAHESRSAKFRPIPTIEPLRALMREGWSPVLAKQSRSRDASRLDFTKHLIRLRRLDDDKGLRVGDTVAELVLKNANDGTSAYDMLAGLWRACCLNGLIAQTATIDTVKVRHTGRPEDVVNKVIEGSFRVLSEAEAALAAPQDWSQIKLNREAAEALAQSAHVIRFGDSEGNVATNVTPGQLLLPRRSADTNPDLWSVWNVIQENAVKGGLASVRPGYTDEEGRFHPERHSSTREVKGVEQDVKLNKALWTLGDAMSKILKQAA